MTIKNVQTMFKTAVKYFKFSLYIIMAARILIALYLRVHNEFDTVE